MPLSLALIAWRMLKPREVGSTDVYSFNPANTVGDRVYIFLALLKNNFIILHVAGGSHVGQHGPRDFKLLAQTRPGSSWWDPSYSLGLFLPIQQVPHGSLEASPLVPSCLSVLITSCQVFQPAPEHQPEPTSALFCPELQEDRWPSCACAVCASWTEGWKLQLRAGDRPQRLLSSFARVLPQGLQHEHP
nr:uncharacterized protein LOC116151470 isoform X2 [Camelus dromedarius]